MITAIRTPTSIELPLPGGYESERANWLYYGINWDNIISNPYQLTHSYGSSTTVIFRGNTITADTDFIAEPGRVLAMRLVLPTDIGYFGAFCGGLTADSNHSDVAFGIQTTTEVSFGDAYPLYHFENQSSFGLQLSGPAAPGGYDLAKVVSGPDADYLQDYIHYNNAGQYESFSNLGYYGERHNMATAGQNYVNNILADALGTNPRQATGAMQLAENLRYGSTRAFPIDVTNPTKLYLNYSWSYGCISDPKEQIASTGYNAPNGNTDLGSRQQYQPQILGVCVLLEPATYPRPAIAQFHDGRLLMASEKSGGIVTRLGTWQSDGKLKIETLGTTDSSSNPSLAIQIDNTPVRARKVPSGEIMLETSGDGGATWG